MTLLQAIKSPLNDFLELLYPNLCGVCSNGLVNGEKSLCTSCSLELPITNFHLSKDNPVAQSFWGKVPIERATAFLYFAKGESTQKILHQLKYKGSKEIGIEMGKRMANQFKSSAFFEEVDLIIPVPLHKKKKRERGYNQSEQISKGLSEILEIPIETTSLVRNIYTKTQTKKSRFSRFENVKDVFSTTKLAAFDGKHILLVDDVVTTGSTIEACALAVKKNFNTKISVVSLAYAE
ncbi:MAG: ComF family protein [Sphingobacteriales bacterium]|jgi:ComF family protein